MILPSLYFPFPHLPLFSISNKMTDYDDILNSLDDNYYSIDGDNLSPSLQTWSNSSDIEEFDLNSLNLSSDSSWVDLDPLESAITATRMVLLQFSAPFRNSPPSYPKLVSMALVSSDRPISPPEPLRSAPVPNLLYSRAQSLKKRSSNGLMFHSQIRWNSASRRA